MGLPNDEFFRLIETNKRIIFKICHVYCQNNKHKEDLAQEIIYHLWKSGKNFDSTYKFSTWMYRIALNVAISYYRNEKKNVSSTSISIDQFHIEDKASSENEPNEHIEKLYRSISQLKVLEGHYLTLP